MGSLPTILEAMQSSKPARSYFLIRTEHWSKPKSSHSEEQLNVKEMSKQVGIDLVGPLPSSLKAVQRSKSENLHSQRTGEHWNESESSNSQMVKHELEEQTKTE